MCRKTFTITDFQKKKDQGIPITMLTAYDHLMAKMIDNCEIDSILIGDSLGMVFQGRDTTLPVTVDEVIYHSKAVKRGAKNAFLIADMPFASYQVGREIAVGNACRFIKEAGVNAVKLEGGKDSIEEIKAIIRAQVPVLGHIGLTPQSINRIGGYKVQGRGKEAAKQLIEDARLLETAGCFAVLLECVPRQLAEKITDALRVPTIGIGAGSGCDGQVLVTPDMVGYNTTSVPSFVKKYADVKSVIENAIKNFREDVVSRAYPDDIHSFE